MVFLLSSYMNEKVKGRGSQFNLPNRFEKLHIDEAPDFRDEYFDEDETDRKIPTIFYNDHSKTILAKNDSPDVSFTYIINPYRGCEHGCIYCYARPTHEYLGFSSGLDFETKIMVKKDAPALLRETLSKKSWIPQSVAFSGNTDCYQPAERNFKITRECLKVFLEFRNPIFIITKNALVQRDVDILQEMASLNIVIVVVSITTLKREVQRKMEPRTSIPARRLETIEFLRKNNIPVGVNVAPIIPGLTDEEVPGILKEAAERGALSAGRTIVRLPFGVKDLFVDWVKRNFPEREKKILNRVIHMRGGKLYNSEWGTRMRGEGEWADTIGRIFETNCNKLNLNKTKISLTTKHFRRKGNVQFELF
jgi:DNA repair photolyase